MANITNTELLNQLKTLVSKAENIELERVNDWGAGGQVAFCCGCICVSACAFNSPAGMRDLRELVEKKELVLPETFNKVLAAEIKKH